MQKLSAIYFGTPSFSADFLEKLLTDKELPLEILSVVTQPDKKVGRKQIITPTPVRLVAEKNKIPVTTNLKEIPKEFDLAIVFAYGEILPKEILQIPRLGFWNIHPSLLPLYRGASPIAYPLMNGDTKTGVTLMKMDEQMDHGPIIDHIEYKIQPGEKRPDLEKKLTNLGFNLLKDVISRASRNPNEISHFVRDDNLKEQDHTKATYTKLLKKEDGFIKYEDLKETLTDSQKSLKLYNRFRGLYPWPGIWTLLPSQKRLKITDITFEDGKLIIIKVQLEGKNEVDYSTFIHAYGPLTM